MLDPNAVIHIVHGPRAVRDINPGEQVFYDKRPIDDEATYNSSFFQYLL